ncbi:MAG: SDR family oxidoreductase [Chitinophagaceae bacterium]|nr:SDR family oxidoreductase [Chitinophagaceae bacterium]
MKANKIALVTGGGRGLGKDMVLSIAKKGIDIVLTYNSNQKAAEDVAAEVRSLGQKATVLKLDVSAVSTFDSFVTELKKYLKSDFNTDKIDFLVNNGGYGISSPSFAETTEDQFDQLMNVHFKGVFFLTQKLLPLLNDGGGIVNISSGLTRVSFAGRGAYASMKAAIETLTRYLAKELGSRNIRVNVVAPGAIATDFGGGNTRDNPQVQTYLKSITAIPRIGQADDIGGIVAFLCSEDAKWMTAQRIEASGGMSI